MILSLQFAECVKGITYFPGGTPHFVFPLSPFRKLRPRTSAGGREWMDQAHIWLASKGSEKEGDFYW